MGQTNEEKSGAASPDAPRESSPAPEAVFRACHEIIDAASALLVNLELLAGGSDPAHDYVVADARASIERIVKLARSLRPLAKDEETKPRP
jgi:hypothetical protein